MRRIPASLYDLLACPTCKVAVTRQGQALACPACGRAYPIVDGVPVMFPDASVPAIQHEADLNVQTGYNPWVERIVMQSLPADAIVLDLGAGNMAFNLPNVIRMDVTLTPYVDVVADAHALPFLPGSFDFIFSLAVIEHLRQPFVAAQEMYDALRSGGYVYGECNFIYPYHGYPYHFFNASQQGLEQVFAQFRALRVSVAPYQMPSFAVRTLLQAYQQELGQSGDAAIERLQDLLAQLLRLPLGDFDACFTEERALRLAAGVFFFGVRSPDGATEVIPEAVQTAWRGRPDLRQRYPDMLNLGTAQNVMLWAKGEARQSAPEVAANLDSLGAFRKSADVGDGDLRAFQQLPAVEPAFGHIPGAGPARAAGPTGADLAAIIEQKNRHIAHLEDLIQRYESGRVMRLLRRLRLR